MFVTSALIYNHLSKCSSIGLDVFSGGPLESLVATLKLVPLCLFREFWSCKQMLASLHINYQRKHCMWVFTVGKVWLVTDVNHIWLMIFIVTCYLFRFHHRKHYFLFVTVFLKASHLQSSHSAHYFRLIEHIYDDFYSDKSSPFTDLNLGVVSMF